MAQSVSLDSIIQSLVESSPPGELSEIVEDLSSVLPEETSSSIITQALENYIDKNCGIFSSSYIASEYNKSPHSTKYADFIGKKLFNIDLQRQAAIDLEEFTPDVDYPEYYHELVSKLKEYGDKQYPSKFAFTVIPSPDDVKIIVIGQRLNKENFYTGQWKSVYSLKEKVLEGTIKIDIHYFEEGNVRLTYEDKVTNDVTMDARSIINTINTTENNIAVKIVENFNDLNQRSFKNLRRLLPVTRSKINWGKAIGNYKLGSDVVNKK
ncbi:Piso0_005441 [Millerozyma farinosa CBS 7064]|uniref:F-actin-capping protein subunit alpha n=1 Tax=Pichia sorbitophila (strain ATCC MYA-4447 / BCRC 22081 / CBS 7064 / NBRC 10061 / NRRL Y-12695) TaxID=559304 RepID=G8XZ09_PICSO|nr:Piso0_005441 [Millerozyma farinosa CBS 7064]